MLAGLKSVTADNVRHPLVIEHSFGNDGLFE